jgi:hypothetical protein
LPTRFSLPVELNERATTPPFRVQIAFDGNWMDALRFAPDELPSNEVLQAALAERETDVAVEFCFKLSTGENFFYGQRRVGTKNDAQTLQFVREALTCGRPDEWNGLPDFFSRVEKVTTGRHGIGSGTLCSQLENIEVGITDWWHRGDVVEVWNKDSNILLEQEELSRKLAPFPSLQRNDIKFVCLELNFRSPLHHWFGIEISEESEGFHHLRVAKGYPWLVACVANFENVS